MGIICFKKKEKLLVLVMMMKEKKETVIKEKVEKCAKIEDECH